MSDSLRDQLLGLGFKPPAKPQPKPSKPSTPHAKSSKPGDRAPVKREGGKDAPRIHAGQRKGSSTKPQRVGVAKPADAGMDLAKAYAIRAEAEKAERIAAEQAKQEEARLRREARAKLQEFLQGKPLNADDAEIARHFPYGGKIKRIYVTAPQLVELNAGRLGVVQQNGRYLLVDAATLDECERIFAPSVALRVDPNAPAEEEPYADSKFQVPDDLIW